MYTHYKIYIISLRHKAVYMYITNFENQKINLEKGQPIFRRVVQCKKYVYYRTYRQIYWQSVYLSFSRTKTVKRKVIFNRIADISV